MHLPACSAPCEPTTLPAQQAARLLGAHHHSQQGSWVLCAGGGRAGIARAACAPQVPGHTAKTILHAPWCPRFFEELDYVKEGENGTLFIEQMRVDLPQVCVAHLGACRERVLLHQGACPRGHCQPPHPLTAVRALQLHPEASPHPPHKRSPRVLTGAWPVRGCLRMAWFRS